METTGESLTRKQIYNRTWAQKNRERIREYKRRERARDPEKFRKRWLKYHAENKEKVNKRNAERHKAFPHIKKAQKLWRYYKLSLEDYENLIQKQNNRCLICNMEFGPQNTKQRINIDHNHDTGKVRGLLCINCNSGLGQFKENLQLLEKAVRYIKENA